MSGLSRYFSAYMMEYEQVLQTLDSTLHSLRQADAIIASELERLFRAVHTLKASAATMKHEAVQQLTHAMEDVLEGLRSGQLDVQPALFVLLANCIERLRTMKPISPGEFVSLDVSADIAQLEQFAKNSFVPDDQAHPNERSASCNVIWFDEQKRSEWALLDSTAPFYIFTVFLQADSTMRAVRHLLAYQVLAEHATIWTVEPNVENSGHARTYSHVVQLHVPLMQMEKVLRNVSDVERAEIKPISKTEVEALFVVQAHQKNVNHDQQMMRLSDLFAPFEGMVKELAEVSGKHVSLHTESTELMLSSRVIVTLHASILQLLRNAVDHGVETAEERIREGKPHEAHISLHVDIRDHLLLLTITDDGRGIDFARLRTVAVARGLIDAEKAKSWSEPQLLPLIFTSGLSLAKQVTELSGRGVGLDIVRTQMEQCKGRIRVRSESGKGTMFQMMIPLADEKE